MKRLSPIPTRRSIRTTGQSLLEMMGVIALMGVLAIAFVPLAQRSTQLARPVQAAGDVVQFLALVESAFRQADPDSVNVDPTSLSFRVPPAKDPITFPLPPNVRAQLDSQPDCATVTFFRLSQGGRPETQIGRLVTCD